MKIVWQQQTRLVLQDLESSGQRVVFKTQGEIDDVTIPYTEETLVECTVRATIQFDGQWAAFRVPMRLWKLYSPPKDNPSSI
jgi:hypothetical protein